MHSFSTKRAATLLLLLSMLVSATGCGNSDLPTDSDADVPAQTDAPQTDASQTEVPETDIPVIDIPETDAPETETPGTASEEYQYKTDISAYEQFIDPADPAEYLILVNVDHPLSDSDIPDDLTDVVDTRGDRAAQQMRYTAEKALEAFLCEARACGYTDVTVTSGYRSYATQDYLFHSYVSRELSRHSDWTQAQAEAYVMTYSCRPGTSEHQSGLCVDMHNLAAADVSFSNQPAAKWLAENCWRFGFVVRFPEDKTDATGISYEPWHFRFVGRTAAAEMNALSMCLEEYTAYLSAQ